MLRIPAAKVSRKPLDLPVRNERTANPAPATSSIQPSTTTETKVVATAIPEAITPSTIKKTPKARYQPQFRSIAASPVLKRFLAASKKLALLIQNSFLSSGCFPKSRNARKTTLINLDARPGQESIRVPRKKTFRKGNGKGETTLTLS